MSEAEVSVMRGPLPGVWAPLGLQKGKKMDSPLEPLEGTQPSHHRRRPDLYNYIKHICVYIYMY